MEAYSGAETNRSVRTGLGSVCHTPLRSGMPCAIFVLVKVSIFTRVKNKSLRWEHSRLHSIKIPKSWSGWSCRNTCATDNKCMWWLKLNHRHQAEYDELCQAIFGIPLTSSFVESLFSKMIYNQSKIRTRLNDTNKSSILYLHDTSLSDPQKSLPSVEGDDPALPSRQNDYDE